MLKRTILLLVVSVVISPAPVRGSEEKNLELAEALLMDVAIRGDIDGLLLARDRLEKWTDDARFAARAHYDLGLATLQLLFAGYRPDAKSEVIQNAIDHLDRAAKKEEDLAPAYALAAICHAFQMQIDKDKAAELLVEAQEKLARAKALEDDDPRVMFVSSMFLLFSGGTREQGIQSLEKTIEVLDTRLARSRRLADWWHVSALTWTAQAMVSSSEPDLDRVRQLIRRSLALRPDYDLARELLDQTEPLTMAPDGSIPSGTWITLLDDPAGDGKVPESVDGKSLSYLYDAKTQRVWLKYTFHQKVDPNSFGVNLVVDNDQDAANGIAWWGTNKEFRFDRLITVWVTRHGTDHYRGIVGVCDARGAAALRMTNLSANNIAFAHLPDENAIVIGLERSHLGTAGALRLIGAVGTHQVWNDDIGDEKAVALELDPGD